MFVKRIRALLGLVLMALVVGCAPAATSPAVPPGAPTRAPVTSVPAAPTTAAPGAAYPVGTPAAPATPVPAATAATSTAVPIAPTAAVVPGASIPNIPAPVAVTVDTATTAYLVLDLTSVVCTPRKSCVASLPAAAALLKKARDAKALVVYSDTPTAGSTIAPEVAPQSNDPKVTGRADKFFGTNLDDILKQKGIKTTVIVGSAANGAVLYTAFGATLRGYTVVVAEDGISSDDAFAVLLTRYQLLNEPGFANATNKPLDPTHVTLSRTDLITFK